MKSLIGSMPMELVDAIIKEVPEGSADLRSLRAVDRSFYHITTPRAFRRIRIPNSLQGAKGLKSIQASEAISRLVEELIFDERSEDVFSVGPYRFDSDYNEFEHRRLQGCLESAVLALCQFPRLKALSLDFWPTWQSQSSMIFQEHSSQFSTRQLKLLDAIYGTNPPSTLASLTVANLCLLYRRPNNSPNSRPSFKSRLTKLTISVLSTEEHRKVAGKEDSPIIHGPGDYIPTSYSPLQSFTLRSPQGLFHSHDLCPHGLYYPRLTILSLHNIVLGRPSSAGSMISFISCHKNTLQTLEIVSCPIIVGEANGAQGFWSHIWNRFAEELTELINFIVVTGPREETILNLGYMTIVENKELETYLLSPPRVDSDRLALKGFQDTVEARRNRVGWSGTL